MALILNSGTLTNTPNNADGTIANIYSQAYNWLKQLTDQDNNLIYNNWIDG